MLAGSSPRCFRLVPLLMTAAAATAPLAASAQGTAPDSAGYVTRLGTDTLAIERFVRTPQRVEAEVLLRIPTTTRTTYVMELAPDGSMRRFESRTFDPGKPGSQPIRTQMIARQGDSLRIEAKGGRGEGVRSVVAPPTTLPFTDMIHWPYEIALMRVRAADTPVVEQPLLSGARAASFRIASIGSDSMTITHPSRGTMRVHVDARGRLLGLDAAQRRGS